MNEPANDVLARLSPKYVMKCGRKMPNELHTPSTTLAQTKEAKTTTQPQPPSGGLVEVVDMAFLSSRLPGHYRDRYVTPTNDIAFSIVHDRASCVYLWIMLSIYYP